MFPGDSGVLKVDARVALTARYAHACPDVEIIEDLAKLPAIELGAGAGYWARLIRDTGGDIAAFDNWSWGRSAPSHLWFPVETGDETVLDDYQDRTLLLVMPRRPGHAAELVRRWSGQRLVVVTGGGFPLADFDGEREAIADRGWHLVEERGIPEAVGTKVASTWQR